MRQNNNVEQKYSEAVSLYATTRLSIKEICEQTQVPFGAFSSYLSRNHRELILKRHNLDGLKKVKLRGTKGQSTASHLKYKDAIAAADSEEYIEYNISQIARIFGLNGTSLANLLRHHYPDVIPNREKERQRLGIADNVHHGVRQWCKEGYAEAVHLLSTTTDMMKDIAERLGLNYSSLRKYMYKHHPEVLKGRRRK